MGLSSVSMSIANLESLEISDRPGAIRFAVRARPRSHKTNILGVKEGALEVSVAAPPVDGEANLELVRGLARALGTTAANVEIVGGQTGKRKIVEVRGLDAATARARLGTYEK